MADAIMTCAYFITESRFRHTDGSTHVILKLCGIYEVGFEIEKVHG